MNRVLKTIPSIWAICCFMSCDDATSKTSPYVLKSNSEGADTTVNFQIIESISNTLFSTKVFIDTNSNPLSNIYSIAYSKKSSDEDNLSWPSLKAFNEKGKLVFEAEANWEDTLNVHRITFYTNDVRTNSNVSTGDPFKVIKRHINTERLNDAPDGELLLFDKTINGLAYYFDVSNNSKLKFGIPNVNEVPLSLKIDMIIFFRPTIPSK